MSLRSWRPASLIAALSLATACVPTGEVRTVVTYAEATGRLHVESHVAGIGASFLGCSGAEDCADAIQAFLHGAPRTSHGRALWQLADEGADALQLDIAAEGDSLALYLRFDTWPGTHAAEHAGVALEYAGRPGDARHAQRLRPQLVVRADGNRSLASPRAAELRVRYVPAPDQPGDALTTAREWVLPRGTTEVVILDRSESDWLPPDRLLADTDGLREVLQRRGMLP